MEDSSARAIANDPSEPTGNLDQKTSEEVMEPLHHIHQTYHKTCLVVTHDMQVANGADYILQMEDGIVQE